MALKISQVIGHRGASAYAPENTLESIHSAADMGAEWVEFDVKLTKDGIPILFHDDTLDRTTNTTGLMADTLYEDVQDLDAGSWFGDSFIGTKIPTLEEALDVLLERGLSANIEIKPCPGREKETAEVVMDALTRCWDEPDRILISSFSHVALETAMDMAPDWHRSLLLEEEWPDNWQDIATHLDVSTINLNGNTVTRDDVEDAIDFGKPVLAYTINDPQKARQLQGWGIDGFFTDEPDTLLSNLIRPVNSNGAAPKPDP
ncbi:MAG: glycerophosphoryl diester phosphodiesterase [Alphaproteobacteria bacterium]|nr:glycerophosphoryl diester phosphodiesterase [Alphaproteobacteria bacterium]MCD8520560.1 glycerophosphoryl diester phosphodiesterase [Alphaproteobacteria bacterium]MCD8571238.1 glycerophosphoryl diester phosphodiesterase [Alphaproteobacteria bacterium]